MLITPEKIKEIILDVSGGDATSLGLQTTLFEDLNMAALDLSEVLITVEESQAGPPYFELDLDVEGTDNRWMVPSGDLYFVDNAGNKFEPQTVGELIDLILSKVPQEVIG